MGSTRDGKVNRQEAKVVASLIAAALEQAEYQTNEFGWPSSIGVVSLVGEEQALEIDCLLRTHLAPDAYERHRLLCGTRRNFREMNEMWFSRPLWTPGKWSAPSS